MEIHFDLVIIITESNEEIYLESFQYIYTDDFVIHLTFLIPTVTERKFDICRHEKNSERTLKTRRK